MDRFEVPSREDYPERDPFRLLRSVAVAILVEIIIAAGVAIWWRWK